MCWATPWPASSLLVRWPAAPTAPGASALVYVPGLAWLKVATGAAWGTVFAVGLAPFVIGDALKSAVAALLPSRPSSL